MTKEIGLSNGRGGERSVTGPAAVPWQIVGVIPVGLRHWLDLATGQNPG